MPSAYYRRCAACKADHYREYHKRRARALGVRPKAEVIAESRKASIRYSGLVCLGCGKGFVPTRTDRLKYCSRACAHSDPMLIEKIKRIAAQRLEATRDERVKRRQRALALRSEIQSLRAIRRGMSQSLAVLAVYAARKERALYPCGHCGKPIGIARAGSGSAKYCSTSCAHRSPEFRESKRKHRLARKARQRAVQVEPVSPLKVFERDGWRCHLCGGMTIKAKRGTYHAKAPELDHIVPLARGGEHSYRNTACAHRVCNIAKSDNVMGQPSLLSAIS